MKTYLIFLIVLFSATIIQASPGDIYWVSPIGAASWTNCKGSTPLDGTAACNLETANINAAAGETVYLRGGTYSIYNRLTASGIYPRNSGSCQDYCPGGAGASKITFAAYPGETPLLEQSGFNKSYGVFIDGKKWIKVTGITFKNFQLYGAQIRGNGSFNEISNCTFYRDPEYAAGSSMIMVGGTNIWSTNNYIHHNYFSRGYSGNSGPCTEGVDLIRIGSDDSSDNYNTVEYNYAEYGAHSVMSVYSKNNVVRGNIFHNEPWLPGCTAYDGTMAGLYGAPCGSASSDTIIFETGVKNIYVRPGLPTNCSGRNDCWALNQPITILLIRSSIFRPPQFLV